MKAILTTVSIICMLLLSGCILFTPRGLTTQNGPPPWAPAHGYRANRAQVVIIKTNPAKTTLVVKSNKPGKGNGRKW